MMITLFILFAGAIIGNFLNTCITKLPRNKPITFKAIACPMCNAQFGWRHSIPILSYILSHGQCCNCNEHIPIRYFLVEILTATGLAALYNLFSLTPEFFFYAILLLILIVITFIDIEHQIIPNRVNALGLILGLSIALLTDHSMKDALIGMLTGGGSLLIVALIGDLIFRKESMGGGDIKMAAMVGCFIGCYGIVVALFYAFMVGGIIGIFARIYHREYLPFAPFIAVGALVFVIAGDYFVLLIMH